MENLSESIDLSDTTEYIEDFKSIINPQGPAEEALAKDWELCFFLIDLLDEAITTVGCAKFSAAELKKTSGIPYSEYYAVIDSAMNEITRMKNRCLQELNKLRADRGEAALQDIYRV